jgi:hypothetical protein
VGPYGTLLREAVIRPVGAQRDYLDCPEAVEDLAAELLGGNAQLLVDRYKLHASPCIVKFRSTSPCEKAVPSALGYLHRSLQRDPEPAHDTAYFSNEGNRVPLSDILDVQWPSG